jgi:hypothetical protein
MLAVVRAAELPVRPEGQRWLVENLWGDGAVGVLGGEPKCFKSFLALDIAVSVATGRPCLRRFAVSHPGRVLLFAAEDALWEVRRRLEGIARAAGVAFEDLDIQVITVPVVRLDIARDRDELEATIAALKPRLVILDPFVRMHRIDENAVTEVAPLLAYLRALQRKYHTAVLLVHHARKGAGHMRGGQALRGSSELHAWGDSNLYMRRKSNGLWLSVEHRNAPSAGGIAVDLVTRENAAALELVERVAEEAKPTAVVSPADRIRRVLRDASGPITVRQIRTVCQMRAETATEVLGQMMFQGLVERCDTGYRLVSSAGDSQVVPRASLGVVGTGNQEP